MTITRLGVFLIPYLLALLGATQPCYSQRVGKVLFKSQAPDDAWDARFDSLGVDGVVLATAVSGSDIYVGGVFSTAGTLAASSIAKWDGAAWSRLGEEASNGVNGLVVAIAARGGDIYVGGDFSSAGGVSVANIAKWDGSSWSALGSGISGDVRAVAVTGNAVYVGGLFSTAGGVSASNVAKWDGTTWSALIDDSNNGINSLVSAIAVSSSLIYFAGSFNSAGGKGVNNIAQWDSSESTWSTLAEGVSADVTSLVMHNNNLVAAGLFTTAGGLSAKKVARWDGATWSAFGNGLSGGEVNALATMGNKLIAGGTFSIAGADSARRIAKWNGSQWSPLGSGIDGGPVFAIGAIMLDVYVGGSFTSSGGHSAQKFARWEEADDPVPVELVSFTAARTDASITLLWQTATETNNFGFELERKFVETVLSLDSLDEPDLPTWQKIAFIPGQGTTSRPHQYSYQDPIEAHAWQATKLAYRLRQIDFDGSFEYYPAIELLGSANLPSTMELQQNYPNPFNPSTVIRFTLRNDGLTTLDMHNAKGQIVRSLVHSYLESNRTYDVEVDGEGLASGVYYYTLRQGSLVESKSMILLR